MRAVWADGAFNYSQMMFDALRSRGLPVVYLTFAGEQHGFVKAENNKRALEAELHFNSRIFSGSLTFLVAGGMMIVSKTNRLILDT